MSRKDESELISRLYRVDSQHKTIKPERSDGHRVCGPALHTGRMIIQPLNDSKLAISLFISELTYAFFNSSFN